MNRWKGDPSQPVVTVCCITYNHEPYIEDALEGFLIQETDFPFEILIHDDASTDRTADIIREYQSNYPNLIKPIYQKENQYSKGNNPGLITIERAKGQYIAFCEGDDYWTKSEKLQKQVEFLRSEPDYVLVHTDFSLLYEETGRIIDTFNATKRRRIPNGRVFEDIILNNFIKTPSVLLRTESLKELLLTPDMLLDWPSGDRYMWTELSRRGKFGYFPQDMVVYRINPFSVTHNHSLKKKFNFVLSSYDQRLYFIKKYGISAAAFKQFKISFYKDIFKYGYYFDDVRLMKRVISKLNMQNGLYSLIKMSIMFAAVIISPGKNVLQKVTQLGHLY